MRLYFDSTFQRIGDGSMNILLVWPKTPVTFWSFTHALPFVSKRSTNPPLGLLTIAVASGGRYFT